FFPMLVVAPVGASFVFPDLMRSFADGVFACGVHVDLLDCTFRSTRTDGLRSGSVVHQYRAAPDVRGEGTGGPQSELSLHQSFAFQGPFHAFSSPRLEGPDQTVARGHSGGTLFG